MASSNIPNPIAIFVSGTLPVDSYTISSSQPDVNGDDATEIFSSEFMGLAKQVIPYSRGANDPCTMHIWVQNDSRKFWVGSVNFAATTARGKILTPEGDDAVFYFREYDPTNDLKGRILNQGYKIYCQIEGGFTDGFDVSPEVHRLSYVEGLKDQQ